jgi:hypothetical protein
VIGLLVFSPLVFWTAWLMCRASRARQASSSDTSAEGVVPAPALEDDPRWAAPTVTLWTALDERQLIRLLNDSAP